MDIKSPKTATQSKIGYIVMVVLLSFIAGLVGGIVGQKDYQEQVNLLNITDLTEKIKARVTNDINPSELLLEMAPSITEIYQYKDAATAKNTKKDTSVVDQLTGGANFEGYALVVTTDGWLMAPTSALAGTIATIRIQDMDGVVYTLEKKIDDTATGISFIKITARNMKPISMASDILTDYPQSHWYIENKITIAPINVTPLGYIDSTQLQTVGVLQKVYNFTADFKKIGAPIVTKQKEVIGVTSAAGVIPLAYVKDALTQVLRASAIARPNLPITYIDKASWTTPLKDPKYKDVKNGAIVIVDKKPATLTTSQGAVTLATGDIIIAVNNDRIDANRSLSEIIAQYHSKDMVSITVQQGETQKTYSVTLQ